MYFSAHEDDSILFMSPNLLHDIHGGRCVRTVFVTAGDAGYGENYWAGRERGAEAAYAKMAGVADSWSVSSAGIAAHPMPLVTLSAAPRISLVFMRLPNYQTDLQDLYTGAVPEITTVDGSSSYTRASVALTLTTLMEGFGPDWIGTHDFLGSFGDGDHSDHHATADLVRDAHRSYNSATNALVGYMGYNTQYQPVNITGDDYTDKHAAWLAYTPHDPRVCQTDAACGHTAYWAWLARQYPVGAEAGGPGVSYPPIADAGPDETVAPTATVQLDGSGSIDPGGTASFDWTQTEGPAVTLSSRTAMKPTFTAPDRAASLTFRLVVTDGQLSSQDDSVTVRVPGPTSDLAPAAVVTASSENVSTGQLAVKAMDGLIGGYPGDYRPEWATVGGKAGSWLRLTWRNAVTVAKVVLYDRPNSADQITGGTLTFSDGSTVAVPALGNDGSATTVMFPAFTTTSVLLKIASVSATTKNIGLAEIRVYPP